MLIAGNLQEAWPYLVLSIAGAVFVVTAILGLCSLDSLEVRFSIAMQKVEPHVREIFASQERTKLYATARVLLWILLAASAWLTISAGCQVFLI